MNAIDTLVKLQKAHYRVLSRSKEQKDMLEIIKKEMMGDQYEIIMQKYGERQKSLLTPYEDFHLIGLMEKSYSELQNLLRSKRINVNGKAIDYSNHFPVYGTIQSQDFQARVIPCDDVPLIVFNEGLLHFVNRVLPILNFEYMYYYNLSAEAKTIINKEFIDTMMCFHLSGEAYYAEVSSLYGPTKDLSVEKEIQEIKYEIHQLLMELTTTGVFFFFAAHEFAHTILKPLKEAKYLNAVINSTEVKTLYHTLNEELEADTAAFILLKETGNARYGLSSLWATVIMYFSHIHELEKDSDHFPFIMRVEHINKLCKENGYEFDYDKIHNIINFKIKAYAEFLEFIDKKELNSGDDIVKIQSILYNEFVLQDV